MKQVLFSNWSFLRMLRLLIGIGVIVQAVIEKDVFFGFAGIVFSGMALFNTGCCAGGTCAPSVNPDKKTAGEIHYEEVK